MFIRNYIFLSHLGEFKKKRIETVDTLAWIIWILFFSWLLKHFHISPPSIKFISKLLISSPLLNPLEIKLIFPYFIFNLLPQQLLWCSSRSHVWVHPFQECYLPRSKARKSTNCWWRLLKTHRFRFCKGSRR